MSASEVSLSFSCNNAQLVPLWFVERQHQFRTVWRPVAQLAEALSRKNVLTSLHPTFHDDPRHVVNLDCLLGALTGLHQLPLAKDMPYAELCCIGSFPGPSCIGNLHCLIRLSVGPSFHLVHLPENVARMALLQEFYLESDLRLYCLAELSALTARQTLELQDLWKLDELPPLCVLTSLKNLVIRRCNLRHLPTLDHLTAL
jgi:hypothetical protein